MTARKRTADLWINEAIATGDIERIVKNMAAAGERINDARRHLKSARLLAKSDVTLAITACHDAIRKAITAHMTANGYRPRNGNGAHRIVLQYARSQLDAVITAADIDRADALRRDRATAEYGDFAASKLGASDVAEATLVGDRIVNAVASLLAKSSRPQ